MAGWKVMTGIGVPVIMLVVYSQVNYQQPGRGHHAMMKVTGISICMILAVLTTAALGKDAVECHFSEPTGGQQCLGAVGQPLLFHLPADREIQLTKDDKHLILK
ncbi:hypothetical protein INR49_007073, partial [Caranx melampygus]